MKIFVDTNIFLTLLLKREGYAYAREILNACADGVLQGTVCDITVLNIDYVASKQTKNLRAFLNIVNETFTIVGVDNTLFQRALEIENDDLEDNVQYVCAKANGCRMIVTDDKAFYRGEISLIDSKRFVGKYL